MKRLTKLPPQIERLAMLTVAIIGSYFIARLFLVPASFGKLGWYRADALKDYAALPISYAGAASCEECHTEEATAKAKGNHKSVSCESCHGPLSAHVQDATVTPAKITDLRFCVRCHEANPSRPEKFPQVNVAEHSGLKNCLECHKAHQPREGLKVESKEPARQQTPEQPKEQPKPAS
jgi:cytochrome c553